MVIAMQIQFCESQQNRAYFIYSLNSERQIDTIKNEIASAVLEAYKQRCSGNISEDNSISNN